MQRPAQNAEWIWVWMPPLLVGLLGLGIYLALPPKADSTATEPPRQNESAPHAQAQEESPAVGIVELSGTEPGSFSVRFGVFEDRRENHSQLLWLKDTFSGKLNSEQGSWGKERPPVNSDRARKEVRDWLKKYGLTSYEGYAEDTYPGEHQRPNVLLYDYGYWGWSFSLYVFEQSPAVLNELQRRLLKLNGVYDLTITAGVPVYEGGRHRVTAPPTPIQVRINGEMYSAQEDFNEGENLLIHSRNVEGERAPRYMFFFSLDLHGPDRFGLGDIVRLGYDGDIQTYDTLVERWDHTPEQHQRLLSGDVQLMAYRNPDRTPRSVGLQLPDWLDESEFDPVAELEAILADEDPLRWGDEPTGQVEYEIRTKEQLARLNGHQILKLVADPADAALEAAFLTGVERWLDANPQFLVRNVFVKPVRYSGVREGGVLLTLRCVIEAADPLPYARDLAASLDGIPDLPTPSIHQEQSYDEMRQDRINK